jgi:cadmium resistance protein CadD (predicted permease)
MDIKQMPAFSLSDFLAYALAYLQSHQLVQLLMLIAAMFIAIKCALAIEAEQQRKEEELVRRLEAMARAQQEQQVRTFEAIRRPRA